MLDPYMTKIEAQIRDNRQRFDRSSVAMRASAPHYSALERRRRLKNLEVRFADVSRRFEQLRAGRRRDSPT